MTIASKPTSGQEGQATYLDVTPEVEHWTHQASRANNEDFYTVPPYANLPGLGSNIAAATARRGLLYVVADGMGGAAKGELASRLATRSLVESYYRDPDLDLRSSLWRAVSAANEAVYRESLAGPANQGMGTTLTALVLHENKVYFGHVGDSRLYRLRGRLLQRLSHDHSLVQEMVDKGTLTLEQARLHPERNKIQRAIGTGPMVDIDTGEDELAIGDVFLLSTDGLHDELSDAQIQQLLTTSGPDSPERLGRTALAVNGGPDNITAVWVRVGPKKEGPIVGGRPRPRPWWERYAYPLAAALVALVGVGWWMTGGKVQGGGPHPEVPTLPATEVPIAEPSQTAAVTPTEAVITAVPPGTIGVTDTPPPPSPAPTHTRRPTSRPGTLTPAIPTKPAENPTKVPDGDDDEDREEPTPKRTDPPRPTDPPPPFPMTIQFSLGDHRWEHSRTRLPPFRAAEPGASHRADTPESDEIFPVPPAFSGSVRQDGTIAGGLASDKSTIDSSLDAGEGYPIGLLQFNLANVSKRWIEGAKIELVAKEKGRARDTSTWQWRIDVLEPAIHASAWGETRYAAFDNAKTAKGDPIVLRDSDVPVATRSTSTFEKCEAVQAMNDSLAQAGGAMVGLRIKANGERVSARWHSGASEPSLQPRLVLELGPEGGPTPTLCSPDSATTAPSPTISQPSSTPSAATGTPSPLPSSSPSNMPTAVAATDTPTIVATPTNRPEPSATSTIAASSTASTTPTATRGLAPRFFPLVIRGKKIQPRFVEVRKPSASAGQGTTVLPSLATCAHGQAAHAYFAVDSSLAWTEDGWDWRIVDGRDELSITDIALTSNCSHILVAKWGGGVYFGEIGKELKPPPGYQLEHKYPYAIAADSRRVVYGATLANNGTGGVFQAPVPSGSGSLTWTRLGNLMLDVRSLLLDGQQDIYAGTIGGAWTYLFSGGWEEVTPKQPDMLAMQRVQAMLLMPGDPRTLLLGTAEKGLWQRVADDWKPATNWPSRLLQSAVTSLARKEDLVVAAVSGHGVYYSRSTQDKSPWSRIDRSPSSAARVAFLDDDLLIVTRDGGIWLLEDAPDVLK